MTARSNRIFIAATAIAIVATSLGLGAAPAHAGNEFFVEPEAVFLQLRQSDTAFAVELDATPVAVGGVVKRLEPGSESGYRFALGYRWAGDWDVTLRFTSLDSEEIAGASSPDNIAPLLTHPTNLAEAVSASAAMDQSYDVITLEVGRTFGEAGGHRARIFGGPNHVSHDQAVAAVYDNFGDPWTVDIANDVSATGIRVGGEGHLALGDGSASLFARTALGAYVTSHEVSLLEIDRLAPAQTIVAVSEEFDGSSLSLEAALGFAWGRSYETWKFGLQVGYEVTTYSGLVNTREFVDDVATGTSVSRDGNLGVNGSFLKLAFTF